MKERRSEGRAFEKSPFLPSAVRRSSALIGLLGTEGRRGADGGGGGDGGAAGEVVLLSRLRHSRTPRQTLKQEIRWVHYEPTRLPRIYVLPRTGARTVE